MPSFTNPLLKFVQHNNHNQHRQRKNHHLKKKNNYTNIHICFLATVQKNFQLQLNVFDAASSTIRNIETVSADKESLRYHLVVTSPPAHGTLTDSWVFRDVPLERIELHAVSEFEPELRELHRQLSSTATGPGGIYLWKPLLHLVLKVPRVIVLDTDIFVFEDVRKLWNEFDAFLPDQLIGLATEQAPTYLEARALGGVGFNGGVQLLKLKRMRRSKDYHAIIQRYAERKWVAMKPGGIGWLGDQTLYSWMSVNGSGANHIFYQIPCGWNRQTGTHTASWKGFWESWVCDEPCNLLHGNFVQHKVFMETLRKDASGQTCRATVAKFRSSQDFRHGSADARVLDMVDTKCCR